jgi:hypothetical protein
MTGGGRQRGRASARPNAGVSPDPTAPHDPIARPRLRDKSSSRSQAARDTGVRGAVRRPESVSGPRAGSRGGCRRAMLEPQRCTTRPTTFVLQGSGP